MILTLEDLRNDFGFEFQKTKEDYYSSLLKVAEEKVLSYAEIEQGEVEEHFPGGDSGYVLTHSPVLEVKGVKLDGKDVAFRFEKRASYVLPSSTDGSEVVVKYTAGWKEGEVPEVIRMAIAFTVQHLAKLSSGKLLGINSRTTEGGTETIEQSVPTLAVQKMLEPFRRTKAL